LPDEERELSDAHRAGARAAKNTGARMVGEAVGKVATFILFAALARAVGEEGLGAFVLAFAILGIAVIPVALGADVYLLRQIARDRSSVDRLFFNILALKLALAAPVLAVTFLIANVAGYDATTRATIYVLAAGVLLDLMAKTLRSSFNAAERGELVAATLIGQRVVTAAVAVAVLVAGFGVVTVAAVYSAGAALGLAFGLVLMKRNLGLPRLVIEPRRWRALVTETLPYGAQDIFGVLLFRLDAVMLSLLATEAAVGRYGAAYRLLESTLFVTWALNGAFAAMYVYLDRNTEPSVQAVFQRSVKAALTVLVPAAVVMGFLAEPICRLAFGDELANAAAPLRLLAPVVVMLSLVALTSSLVVSRRGPGPIARITGAMVVLNAALNVALIPPLADSGAALAMLITETIFVVVALRLAVDTVGGVDWAPMVAAPATGGLAMGAVFVLLYALPLAALALGLGVYAAVFWALERRVAPGDLRFVSGLLRRRLGSRAAA
jgi:O-antigen/teichoic acid export membrane protein